MPRSPKTAARIKAAQLSSWWFLLGLNRTSTHSGNRRLNQRHRHNGRTHPCQFTANATVPRLGAALGLVLASGAGLPREVLGDSSPCSRRERRGRPFPRAALPKSTTPEVPA